MIGLLGIMAIAPLIIAGIVMVVVAAVKVGAEYYQSSNEKDDAKKLQVADEARIERDRIKSELKIKTQGAQQAIFDRSAARRDQRVLISSMAMEKKLGRIAIGEANLKAYSLGLVAQPDVDLNTTKTKNTQRT